MHFQTQRLRKHAGSSIIGQEPMGVELSCQGNCCRLSAMEQSSMLPLGRCRSIGKLERWYDYPCWSLVLPVLLVHEHLQIDSERNTHFSR
jgi:hypothetical protein